MEFTTLLNTNITPEDLIVSVIVQMHKETVLKFNRNLHKRYEDKTGNTIGCGCIYCLTLNRYSNLKKLIHRVKKRILDDNYIYLTDEQRIEDEEYLSILEAYVKDIKKEKDNLKIQLNL